MGLLEDPAKSALLGSERRPLAPPKLPTGMEAVAARFGASSEDAFLAAVAVLGQCQEAGFSPGISPVTLPQASAPEQRAVWNSTGMRRLLRRILDLESVPVLSECLRLLETRGRIFPPWYLPELLERAQRHQGLREILPAVIGHRGRWLAAHKAEWRFALEDPGAAPVERIWTEGSLLERLAFLTQMRSTQPGRARELLVSGFEQEPASTRGALVKVLGIGLSSGDEAFLESVLKDRSREVAAEAAALIARLPGSAFAGRVEKLLGQCLQSKRAWLVKFQLEVTPPETFVQELAEAGVRENRKFPGNLGNRAGWLLQLVALVRPGWWTDTLQKPMETILEAMEKSEWKDALLMGLRMAVVSHRDLAWMEALRARGAGQDDLFSALPPGDLEKAMAARLGKGSADWGESVIALVDAFKSETRPWNREISDLVLDRVLPALSVEAYALDWRLRAALKQVGAFIHPSCLRRTDLSRLPGMKIREEFAEARGLMVDTMDIRIQLQEELAA